MVKRYLVTGGAGFIGSHLCDSLVERGDSVVVVDNLDSGSAENLHAAVEFVQDDIRKVDLAVLGRFDAAIHLAALISGYDSLSDPQEYVDVNINGTLRLIEGVARAGSRRIIFASSSTVYGANSGPRLDELAMPAPLTVYAMTKLAGEQLLRMYSQLRGFSHCSLRLFNVYGPRQSPDHPYANVTCKFSHAAAAGLPVQLYGDGEQTRDFIFVDDVIRAFLAVLDGSNETIYNVGTGIERSVNDLLGSLEALTNSGLQVEQRPPWPNDTRSISANVDRFSAEFGSVSTMPIEEGLARTVDSFRNSPGKLARA